MRSQSEILKKIDGLYKLIVGKHDPIYYQYITLVHKLSWDNAKQFYPEDKRTEEHKKKFEESNKTDKVILRGDIMEQLDVCAMHLSAKDQEAAIVGFLVLFSLIWLMGDKYNTFLQQIWMLFEECLQRNKLERVFLEICNELGFSWEHMKLRYEAEKKKIILPGDKDFK